MNNRLSQPTTSSCFRFLVRLANVALRAARFAGLIVFVFSICFPLVALASDSETVDLEAEDLAVRSYSLEQLNAQNVWFVSAQSGLNCRSEASSQSKLIYGALPLFTSLVAYDFVGERGVAQDGLNWLRVLPRGLANPEPCFVAADRRFIQADYPDTTLVGSLGQLPEDITCELHMPGTTNQTRLVTLSHIIYLCTSPKNLQPIANVNGYLSFRRNGDTEEPVLKLEGPEFDSRGGGRFIFRNNGYSYFLDLPSFRYPSSYLSVIFPDGSGYDELILEWLY